MILPSTRFSSLPTYHLHYKGMQYANTSFQSTLDTKFSSKENQGEDGRFLNEKDISLRDLHYYFMIKNHMDYLHQPISHKTVFLANQILNDFIFNKKSLMSSNLFSGDLWTQWLDDEI